MYATGTQVPGPFKSITAGLCLSIAVAENKNEYIWWLECSVYMIGPLSVLLGLVCTAGMYLISFHNLVPLLRTHCRPKCISMYENFSHVKLRYNSHHLQYGHLNQARLKVGIPLNELFFFFTGWKS